MSNKLTCPRCSAELKYKKESRTMFCPVCGYEVGVDFNKQFQIKNKDVKDKNLPMGSKFELGSFI